MRSCLLTLLLLPVAASETVVLDRIAVVVGKHVIKASDIDREVRLADFVNGQPLDMSPAARRKAAERLIDQEIIRNEIQIAGYETATPESARKLLAELKASRSRSDSDYRAALRRYGITEQQLESQLQWQLTVLRFIDQRFRPGALVSDQDVRDYYERHTAELRRASGPNTSLQAVRPKIEEILIGEQVNKQFFDWLDQSRKQTRIEFREDAFK